MTPQPQTSPRVSVSPHPENAPKRIQRKREKGWRMPEGAVYVGRPTKWGNPWKVGDLTFTVDVGTFVHGQPLPLHPMSATEACERYRGSVFDLYWPDDDEVSIGERAAVELRGRDLACWCPLDQPCHADVLLEIANPGFPPTPKETQ